MVSSRQAELDRLEASLDQRRSSLEERERAPRRPDQRCPSPVGPRKGAAPRLSEADEPSGAGAGARDGARRWKRAADLIAERQALDESNADYDARLEDYAALQKAWMMRWSRARVDPD
jgi:hypothetical protein